MAMSEGYYYVCDACNAKWFHHKTQSACPRCGQESESTDRILVPWVLQSCYNRTPGNTRLPGGGSDMATPSSPREAEGPTWPRRHAPTLPCRRQPRPYWGIFHIASAIGRLIWTKKAKPFSAGRLRREPELLAIKDDDAPPT